MNNTTCKLESKLRARQYMYELHVHVSAKTRISKTVTWIQFGSRQVERLDAPLELLLFLSLLLCQTFRRVYESRARVCLLGK